MQQEAKRLKKPLKQILIESIDESTINAVENTIAEDAEAHKIIGSLATWWDRHRVARNAAGDIVKPFSDFLTPTAARRFVVSCGGETAGGLPLWLEEKLADRLRFQIKELRRNRARFKLVDSPDKFAQNPQQLSNLGFSEQEIATRLGLAHAELAKLVGLDMQDLDDIVVEFFRDYPAGLPRARRVHQDKSFFASRAPNKVAAHRRQRVAFRSALATPPRGGYMGAGGAPMTAPQPKRPEAWRDGSQWDRRRQQLDNRLVPGLSPDGKWVATVAGKWIPIDEWLETNQEEREEHHTGVMPYDKAERAAHEETAKKAAENNAEA